MTYGIDIVSKRDDNDVYDPIFIGNHAWNGRTVRPGGLSLSFAQEAIKTVNTDQDLIDEIQEFLKISEQKVEEEFSQSDTQEFLQDVSSKSIDDLFDDLDSTDLLTGTSKRDVIAVGEMVSSAAHSVEICLKNIYGSFGIIYDNLVIAMALQSAKRAVINDLVRTNRISGRDSRMLKFCDTIDSVSGDVAQFLKQEFETAFTTAEKVRLPDLQALVGKEFRKHVSTGLQCNGEKVHRGDPSLNYSKLEIVSSDPNYPILKKGGIGFINGIYNQFDDAKRNAETLSNYAKTKIHLLHNATHYGPIDLVECVIGKLGISTHPSELLQLQWEEFFDTHGPDAKFLQICHSQGAIHVKNALLNTPQHIRERIFVLAIAPGAVITPELCFKSWNYKSRDIIPSLCVSTSRFLIKLEPHSDAPLWDHFFDSPTYQNEILKVIKEYLETYGEKN